MGLWIKPCSVEISLNNEVICWYFSTRGADLKGGAAVVIRGNRLLQDDGAPGLRLQSHPEGQRLRGGEDVGAQRLRCPSGHPGAHSHGVDADERRRSGDCDACGQY